MISSLVFVEWVFCSLVSASSLVLKSVVRGWGFGSVVEHLPSKRKALGLVPSSEKKKRKKKKKSVVALPGRKCFWDPDSCGH